MPALDWTADQSGVRSTQSGACSGLGDGPLRTAPDWTPDWSAADSGLDTFRPRTSGLDSGLVRTNSGLSPEILR